MAERCESTSRNKNEKKEWRIVRVNTEKRTVVPCRGYIDGRGRLWQSKSQSDRPIIREWWESGQPTPSGVVGREVRARPRAHGTIWRSGCSAAPPPRRLTSSGFRAVMALCGLVVTLHRQTIGCRSRAAVGSTSSAAAGYWLLWVCSRNSWLGLFRLHLRFRYVLYLVPFASG